VAVHKIEAVRQVSYGYSGSHVPRNMVARANRDLFDRNRLYSFQLEARRNGRFHSDSARHQSLAK
jgi:hypothetical protein